jgi:hypothetical protein
MRINDEHFIDELQTSIRVSPTSKVGPGHSMFPFLPCPLSPKAGAVVLARREKIDRNETAELVNVRRCVLQEEDLSGVVFGNRRVMLQFEGYARSNGDSCDMLSVRGLCDLVESKHARAATSRSGKSPRRVRERWHSRENFADAAWSRRI